MFLLAFLSSADFFQNGFFQKKVFQEYHRSDKYVRPDLDPNV